MTEMNNTEACRAGRDLILGFQEEHRVRARHIGSVGIALNLEKDPIDEASPDLAVIVGVKYGPIPPRIAPALQTLLEVAEVVAPIRYGHSPNNRAKLLSKQSTQT